MEQPDNGEDWIAIYLVGLVLAALLTVIGMAGHEVGVDNEPVHPSPLTTPTVIPSAIPSAIPTSAPPAPRPPSTNQPEPTPTDEAQPRTLPGGGTRVFAGNRFLVAYYGTAGSGALGVLGEASPARIMPRLRNAADDFAKNGRRVQPVFELIVTIAHAGPTKTGAYSSDIARWKVEQYRRAAHKYGVLLVLDIQPGKANFLDVAKRWEWALRDPYVGLALDPEWRMSQGGTPGSRIGSVGAPEVNIVSAWLDELTAREKLPQKVFMLHQFRQDMIRRTTTIVPRHNLAMVQHIDGFGTPSQKMATFRHVVRPSQFALGFKLFYDEDVPRMRPEQVLRIRPEVKFVSFQ